MKKPALLKSLKNPGFYALSLLLAILTGIADSLKGVFSPLFQTGFGFSVSQIGLLVAAGYTGSLCFLLFSGRIIERLGHLRSLFVLSFVLAFALVLELFGSVYAFLFLGILLNVGSGTLLCTVTNLCAPLFSDDRRYFYLNVMFSVQCIGLVLNQCCFSYFASEAGVWYLVNGTIAVLMIFYGLMLRRVTKALDLSVKAGREDKKDQHPVSYAVYVLMMLSLTFYLLAEHSMFNYLILYGRNELGMESHLIGRYLSLFSLGILVGRLVLSPFIDRVGPILIVLLCDLAAVFCFAGIFNFGIISLCFFAGLSGSIIYPTVLSLLGLWVPAAKAVRCTNFAIAFASFVDILYNSSFGLVSGALGLDGALKLLTLYCALATLLMFCAFLSSHRAKCYCND